MAYRKTIRKSGGKKKAGRASRKGDLKRSKRATRKGGLKRGGLSRRVKRGGRRSTWSRHDCYGPGGNKMHGCS